MSKARIVVIGCIFMSVFQPGAAQACTCDGGDSHLNEIVARSGAVFSATAARIRHRDDHDGMTSGGGKVITWFDVEEVARGSVPNRIKLRHNSDGASCGQSFKIGRLYLIATNTPRSPDTGTCGTDIYGLSRAAVDTYVRAALEEPSEPEPRRSPSIPPEITAETDTGPGFMPWLLIGLSMAALGSARLWIRSVR